MNRRIKRILHLTWIGLIGVALSLIAAGIVVWRWGPLWGDYGFVMVAAAFMILLFLLMVGFEEFIRPRNEYTRVHPMFSFLDLGPNKELRSSDPRLLVMGAPLLVGAVLTLLIGELLF